MVRFVHTADLQLGMTRRFLTAEAQARFAHARLETLRAIARLAAEEHCQFVVACGDVFEANQVDRQVVARALEAMADIPVPVYLLPGNHDPLDAGSVLASPFVRDRRPPNVFVLDEPGVVPVAPGVELVAAPWTSKRPLADLLGDAVDLVGPAPPGTTRVAVGHGAVDTLSPDRDNPALIGVARLESALADGRVHYVALGDRHSTTSVGTTGRVWYAGAPEATDFDEVDAGNVLVVEVAQDDSVAAVPHRLGRWRFLRRAFTLDGPDDLDALDAWLHAVPGKAEAVVRLDLDGTLTLAQRARLDEVLAEAAELFAALDVFGGTDSIATVTDAHDTATLGLTGFAERALRELEELAVGPDPDAAAEANGALSLLFRLAKGAA